MNIFTLPPRHTSDGVCNLFGDPSFSPAFAVASFSGNGKPSIEEYSTSHAQAAKDLIWFQEDSPSIHFEIVKVKNFEVSK